MNYVGDIVDQDGPGYLCASANNGVLHLVILPPPERPEIPLFNSLSEAERHAVLTLACRKRIARGSAFFRENDSGGDCHLLLSGQIKVVQTTAAGDQVVVRFVGPGEIFGCPAILGSQVYPGSAEALTDSEAAVWDAASLTKAMLATPRLAVNALEILGARLLDTQARLREMATERVERRVARALLRLMRQSGRPAADGIEIGFPLSRQDLAEVTGATLHTVSRILAGWEQQGILGGGRQRVVIRDADRLTGLADD